MLKSRITTQIKLHPFATAIFILYVLSWIVIGYASFYCLVKRDGETLESVLFYFFGCVFLPYFIITMYLGTHSEKYAAFYKELSFLISIPMGIVGMVYVAHELIRYFNMGV